MMSIPFQCGVVTDIMLEKDIGNPRCHRLRIIALFESDFNQAKWLIIGRKLLHHMDDTSLAPTMQFGSRPGKQCPSAVLKKVLAHDTIRISKRTAAFMELDAVGCYDRILNSLLLMLLRLLGFPSSVCQCMGQIWDEIVHHIKTM